MISLFLGLETYQLRCPNSTSSTTRLTNFTPNHPYIQIHNAIHKFFMTTLHDLDNPNSKLAYGNYLVECYQIPHAYGS